MFETAKQCLLHFRIGTVKERGEIFSGIFTGHQLCESLTEACGPLVIEVQSVKKHCLVGEKGFFFPVQIEIEKFRALFLRKGLIPHIEILKICCFAEGILAQGRCNKNDFNVVLPAELQNFVQICLVKMIENYIFYYNYQRLQRNLGILTPMQKHELYKAA